jgi:hypothetical protein
LAEKERRRARAKAERPMPSNAKDDGSGAVVSGVSENWFVITVRIAEFTEALSVTVRLVAAEEKFGMLSLSMVLEEADRESPFGDSISMTPNAGEGIVGNVDPLIVSDASVIGSFAGAVMVNAIVALAEPKLTSDGSKVSPGLFTSVTGETGVWSGITPVAVTPEMVLSFTVQVKPLAV